MAKKIYIAGPMTGLPNYNFAAFDAAAERLRADGHEVINPAEMSRNALGGRSELEDFELAELMADEIAAITECDAIYLLCGWHKSNGARKELYHAIGNGLHIIAEGEAA